MRPIRPWSALVLAIAIALPAFAGDDGGSAVRPARDFAYEDVNPASATHGQKLALSELWSDRGVVVNFLASWCGYCWKELPDLEKLHAAKRVRVVGIAADEYGAPLDLLLGLVKRAELTIPILFVPPEDATLLEKDYDHEMLPATYLIDREGAIRRVLQGKVPEQVLRTEIHDRLGS